MDSHQNLPNMQIVSPVTETLKSQRSNRSHAEKHNWRHRSRLSIAVSVAPPTQLVTVKALSAWLVPHRTRSWTRLHAYARYCDGISDKTLTVDIAQSQTKPSAPFSWCRSKDVNKVSARCICKMHPYLILCNAITAVNISRAEFHPNRPINVKSLLLSQSNLFQPNHG
jgi:hypothetical protein